jgi:glycosyltransferase involved in cell wall biosynthesis
MIILSISLFLTISYVLLIIYYLKCWIKIKPYNAPPSDGIPNTVITVVIAARNEEKNIGACIGSILKQTYPRELFEIVVVDDHSIDATAKIATSFSEQNVTLIKLNEIAGNNNLNSYKKKAVETGINYAHGNLIVTTDADCLVHPQWLEIIASFYNKFNPAFIASPVVYAMPLAEESFFKKSLKIFQSLDFIMLQGITGASVNEKIHNMCNGANLAYEKKVFCEVEGFKGIDEIASGDDMLLMQKIQNKYPSRIGYLQSTNAIVQTQSAETLKDFMSQRIRWASKADKYHDARITSVLVLVYLFNAWLFFMAIYSFFSFHALELFLAMLVVKTMVELIFICPVANFFNRKQLLWWFPFLQPFHIIYTLIAGWLGKFGSYSWKGRTVK